METKKIGLTVNKLNNEELNSIRGGSERVKTRCRTRLPDGSIQRRRSS